MALVSMFDVLCYHSRGLQQKGIPQLCQSSLDETPHQKRLVDPVVPGVGEVLPVHKELSSVFCAGPTI